MTLNKSPYRGVRDFFPKEKRELDFIFSHFKESSRLFGYEAYDGPILEEVALYQAKSGEELIGEQIYSFKDRGDRFVAIRPEMTPTLARMIAQVYNEVPRPLRWFSIPNLMRYERPQKGRLREHWQFNCDIFGADEYFGVNEILGIAVHLLQSFGANEEHFEIRINNRKIIDSILSNVLNLSPEDSLKAYKILDKSKKISQEELLKILLAFPFSDEQIENFKNYLLIDNFENLKSYLEKHQLADSLAILSSLRNFLDNSSIYKYLQYDPSIVRGLDYYTGTVFEIYDKNPVNRRAICGGGTYENLLTIFGEDPICAVGLGLGDVTLSDFLKENSFMPNFITPCFDLFLSAIDESSMNACTMLADKLRQENISVLFHPYPLKPNKSIPLAIKRGCQFAAFIGADELNSKTFQVKHLVRKEQKTFSTEIIPEFIQWFKNNPKD